MFFSWQAGLLAGLFIVLTGCQTPLQTKRLLAAPPDIPRQHIIAQVPFYPQQQYYCGPTTLAEVAGFYGLTKTPVNIAASTFTPGLNGTLQIQMAAATRQLGLLAYEQRGSISQLLSLVADNIPVIVLQNNSIALLPQWHYAVVVGYNIDNAEVILHSGVTEAHRLTFSTFERTWQRGDYWMLAMLPATAISDHLDPFIYTKACQDLLSTGQTEAGVAALVAATRQWPAYWLPYFLLGNHYYATKPELAARWYAQGFPVAQQHVSYLNNYALLLSQLGCYEKATALIEAALQLAPTEPNLLDSQQHINSAQQPADTVVSACPLTFTS